MNDRDGSDDAALTGAEKESGFARVMRRLRELTPEERALLAAETELALAESVVLEKRFLAGLDNAKIDRLIRDLDRDESDPIDA